MTEADTKRLAEIRERTEDWCREDNDSQEGCHTLIDTDIPWLLDLVARLQDDNTTRADNYRTALEAWNAEISGRLAAEQRIAKLEAALTEIAESDHNSKATTVAHEALEKP